MNKSYPLDAALVEAAKDAERICREKPEVLAPQVNELRRLGVSESAIPFVMGFYAGTALLLDSFEQAKEEARRRDMFTVMTGGRG